MTIYRSHFALLIALVSAGGAGCSTPCPGGAIDQKGRCVVNCNAAEDGAVCAEGICFNQVCQPPRCGDGFLSEEEECDDGNEVAEDGCEPESCTFSCMADHQCDDGNPCNGTESCTEGGCTSSDETIDDIACMPAVGIPGRCREQICVPEGCGNALVDEGEDCDDGNDDEEDGCRMDCTFTCNTNIDCDNGEICDGAETCNLLSNTCIAGPDDNCCAGDEDCDNGNICDGADTCNPLTRLCETGEPLVCNDGDTCTDDSCDPVDGCEYDFIDADGDGFAPGLRCASGRPAGDCHDRNAFVKPNQSAYFTTGYCPFSIAGTDCTSSARSFDYNCNGDADLEVPRARVACTLPGELWCVGDPTSWVSYVPSCGRNAQLNTCGLNAFRECVPRSSTATQGCH